MKLSHDQLRALSNLCMQIRPAILVSLLKRILPIQRQYVSADIGSFYIDPLSQFGNTLLNQSTYESRLLNTVQNQLAPGDTFVDLGANEGFFSVAAGQQVGSTGTVLAIEPQQRLQTVLQRNFIRNGVADRIRLLAAAISDMSGEAAFHLSPNTNTGSSGLARTTAYRVKTDTVPVMRLGEALDAFQIDRVDLIKIDIEGFEYEAVMGAKDVFVPDRITKIALELHPSLLEKRGHNPDDLKDFLKAQGYTRDPTTRHLLFVPANTGSYRAA